MTEPKPSNERNGNFLDPQWCCKVCDGEIPDGHLECCDIWKLEKKLNSFIANEYSTALDERDTAQSQLATAQARIATLESLDTSHLPYEKGWQDGRTDAWECYQRLAEPLEARICQLEARLREAERLLRSALTEIVVTDPTATVYGEIVTWLENDLKG